MVQHIENVLQDTEQTHFNYSMVVNQVKSDLVISEYVLEAYDDKQYPNDKNERVPTADIIIQTKAQERVQRVVTKIKIQYTNPANKIKCRNITKLNECVHVYTIVYIKVYGGNDS